MKIENIKTGDIVIFERDRQTFHGKVTSKGFYYISSPFISTDEPILFVRVIEHPEWKTVLTSKEVIDVIIIKEKVQFT